MDVLIREVKNLSRLNHINVVRYYASWIDTDCSVTNSEEEDQSKTQESDDRTLCSTGESEMLTTISNTLKEIKTESYQFSDDLNKINVDVGPSLYLYIQMELCNRLTLSDLIMNQTVFKMPKTADRIIFEIACGLEHIHSNDIIHRDLKPLNIFLDNDYHVKIGDFGLSRQTTRTNENQTLLASETLDQSKEIDIVEFAEQSEINVEILTENIGTFLYMAPEMRYSDNYSNKIDIFSFGMIIFEMHYPFKTKSERIQTMTEIKNGLFPDDMTSFIDHKKISFIRRLLDIQAEYRPNIKEILQWISETNPEQKLFPNQLDLLKQALIKKSFYEIQCFMKEMFNIAKNKRSESSFEPIATMKNFEISSTNICVNFFRLHSNRFAAFDLFVPTVFDTEHHTEMITTEACFLMDSQAKFITLPSNMRINLAMYLGCDNEINFVRRSSIDKIFLTLNSKRQEYFEANFDIIWSSLLSKSIIIPYIELIGFSIQFLLFFISSFNEQSSDGSSIKTLKNLRPFIKYEGSTVVGAPAKSCKFIIHITCVNVLSSIFALLHFNSIQYVSLLHLLTDKNSMFLKKNLNHLSFYIRNLFSGSPESTTEILIELLSIELPSLSKFTESIEQILLKEISKDHLSSFKSHLHSFTQQLDKIENLSLLYFDNSIQQDSKQKLSDCFEFRYSLANFSKNSYFYTDFIVSIYEESIELPLKLIAVGGKYENLVKIFHEGGKNSKTIKSAIGISFNVEKLTQMLLLRVMEKNALLSSNLSFSPSLSPISSSSFDLLNEFQSFRQKLENFTIGNHFSTMLSIIDVLIIPLVPDEIELELLRTAIFLSISFRRSGLIVELLPEIRNDNENFPLKNLLRISAEKSANIILIIDPREEENGMFVCYCSSRSDLSQSDYTKNFQRLQFKTVDITLEKILKLIQMKNSTEKGRSISQSPNRSQQRTPSIGKAISSAESMNFDIEFIEVNKNDRRRYQSSLIAMLQKQSFLVASYVKIFAINLPLDSIILVKKHLIMNNPAIKAVPGSFGFMLNSSSSKKSLQNYQIERIVDLVCQTRDQKEFQSQIQCLLKTIFDYLETLSKINQNKVIVLVSLKDNYRYEILT